MNKLHRNGVVAGRVALAGLLFISLGDVQAESVSQLPKPADYINDFAHVLPVDVVARLDQVCSQLDHSQANAQVAVVTVHNLNGEDAAAWANELENKWHMGKQASDRGVLMVLAVDDHKYRIDVGYGLEGILNDAKIGDIGRSMVPLLRAKDYDGAVAEAVGQLASVIAKDAGVRLTGNESAVLAQQPTNHGPDWKLDAFFVVWGCMFLGIITVRLIYGPRGRIWGIPWSISITGFDGGGSGRAGSGTGGSGFSGFGGGSFGGGGAGGSW